MLVQMKEIGSKSGNSPNSVHKDDESGFMDKSGILKRIRDMEHAV